MFFNKPRNDGPSEEVLAQRVANMRISAEYDDRLFDIIDDVDNETLFNHVIAEEKAKAKKKTALESMLNTVAERIRSITTGKKAAPAKVMKSRPQFVSPSQARIVNDIKARNDLPTKQTDSSSAVNTQKTLGAIAGLVNEEPKILKSALEGKQTNPELVLTAALAASRANIAATATLASTAAAENAARLDAVKAGTELIKNTAIPAIAERAAAAQAAEAAKQLQQSIATKTVQSEQTLAQATAAQTQATNIAKQQAELRSTNAAQTQAQAAEQKLQTAATATPTQQNTNTAKQAETKQETTKLESKEDPRQQTRQDPRRDDSIAERARLEAAALRDSKRTDDQNRDGKRDNTNSRTEVNTDKPKQESVKEPQESKIAEGKKEESPVGKKQPDIKTVKTGESLESDFSIGDNGQTKRLKDGESLDSNPPKTAKIEISEQIRSSLAHAEVGRIQDVRDVSAPNVRTDLENIQIGRA